MVAAAGAEGNEDEVLFLRDLQALFKDIMEHGLIRWDAPKEERSMAIRFLMHFMDLNSGEGTKTNPTMHAFLGNEVQHAVPYLGNWFEPHLTQDVVRRALNFGFRNADWGLYGNDDLGATSAFYVWGALGIYPVMAGVGGVTLVTPSFREGEISLPDGRSIKIRANKQSMRDRFVNSMTRDGRASSNLWISAQELVRGTELVFDIGTERTKWGQHKSDAPPSYSTAESRTPTGYGSIWLEEGDDGTGASSHSAFDGDQQSAWHFVSESDGSKVLEVEFTSVYAASGLLLRHADVGRTSTFNDKVSVSVSVKGSDGSWSDVATTKGVISWIDVTTGKTVHDVRRMLLDFDAGEVEIHGLRLTFAGLNVNEEHGIYEVLAKGGSVVERARLRSQRSLLEGSLGDGVSWREFSPNPVLSVGGLHERFQATAGVVLVLGESHISVEDLDTWVPETGDAGASRITLRVRGVVGGVLQERTSLLDPWVAMDRDDGSPADAPVYSFSLADLRADKIGFLSEDESNDITFTIQAEDDEGHLSDSDSVRSGDQPSSVRIPVVGLVKVIVGEPSSVNLDGALTPDLATLNRWRGAAGALTILVELHRGENIEELLLGSHGVTSIVSSWSWDPERKIGTLSLQGSSSARASDFRSVLGFLQLRSAVGVSEGYRRILVRPDISGSAFRKDFHVREVKVYVNDAPEASKVPDKRVDEDATATYVVPAFRDDEDTELEYEAKLVVGDGEQDLPAWIDFDEETRTFTFTPHKSSDAGRYRLRVRGTDSGGLSAEAEFVLTVLDFNDVPVASTLVDRKVAEDTTASYRFKAFTDEEEDKFSRSLAYTAFWAEKDSAGRDIVDADGKQTFVSLPRWIVFDGSTRRFTFKPDRSWHAGRYTLRVVGTDKGIGDDDKTKKSAIADFVLDVVEVNDAPVASSLVGQTVVEDTEVFYPFPVFTDEESDAAGVSLTYTFSVVRVGAEETPVDVSSWMQLGVDPDDTSKQRFAFTPSDSSHAGTYKVTVVGEDAGIGGDDATKKSDFAEFVLDVVEVNDVPVASPLQDQQVDEDTIASYRFKAFTDEETPSSGLVYSAHLLVSPSSSSGEVLFEGSPASEERSSGSEGSVRSRRVSSVHTEASLPDWISFDGGQRLFRFSPETGAHVGRHVLRVRARDASGKTKTMDFTLHVSATNDAPEADVSIEGSLEEGRVVRLRVAGLSDEDGVPFSSRSHRYRWYESSEPEVQSSWSLISGAEGASFRLGSGQAGKYLARCFFLHGLRWDTGACICAKRGGCSSQEFACCGGSDIWRGEGEQFFERVCFRGGGGSRDGFAQFESGTREAFVDEEQAELGEWRLVLATSAVFASSGVVGELAGEWSADSAEPTSTRYHHTAEWWPSATFLATSGLAGEWGASSAEPTSTRYERAAKRRRPPRNLHRSLPQPSTSSFAGGGVQAPQSPQAQGTSAQQSGGTPSQPSSQPPTSRGVGGKFRRAHKRKVRARSKATLHRLSSRCRRRPPRSLALPHSRISPSSRVPTRRPNPRKEPQSRSLQRMQKNRKSAEMHQSREPQRRSRRMYRSRSSRRTRHPRPSTPVSRKTDPLSDTELQKDLGGSELPTSVRLSPHDIHTEITFISEDEVNVQLSLAEGAPMEISVRALATQLTGDDAVRIEILDLPEGLRFDRETGMLEDTLGSGLSADGVAEVRVMLTDAQGRRMTVTLQVLSAEGLSQPEAATKLEGRTQTDEQTGSGELGGGRRDVGGSSDGAGLSEGEGSEGSDSVGDAALEELSGDKEARSSSGSAGSGSAARFPPRVFCELFWQGRLAFAEFVSIRLFSGSFPGIFF